MDMDKLGRRFIQSVALQTFTGLPYHANIINTLNIGDMSNKEVIARFLNC